MSKSRRLTKLIKSRVRTWEPMLIVKAYKLAKAGLRGPNLAIALNLSPDTLKKWRTKYPELDMAIKEARDDIASGGAACVLQTYVYDRLPDDLKRCWDKINEWEKETNGIARIEKLLQKRGKYARMHLFVYAMTTTNFSVSEACRSVNISKSVFDHWKDTEPDFARLLDEVMEHKKNFFEGALVKKVGEGDINAILFANRTINRDRGYTEKKEVEVTGNIHHSMIDIEKLDLSFECRREILEAIRKQKDADNKLLKQNQGAAPALTYKPRGIAGDIIDGEVIKSEVEDVA